MARAYTLVATRAPPPREKRPDKKICVREIERSRRREHVRNIIYVYIGDLRNNSAGRTTGRDKYFVCIIRCGCVVVCWSGASARAAVAGLDIFF